MGEDCTYADGTLCLPNLCSAPKEAILAYPELAPRDYIFVGKNGAEIPFRPKHGGYELHRICRETVYEAATYCAPGNSSCTHLKQPWHPPIGCGDISPLPTYFAGSEGCDESDPGCNPGVGKLIGSSLGLIPLWVIAMILLVRRLPRTPSRSSWLLATHKRARAAV